MGDAKSHNEEDFKKLADSLLDLTISDIVINIQLSSLNFMVNVGEERKVIFSSKNGSDSLGVFKDNDLIFELNFQDIGKGYLNFLL